MRMAPIASLLGAAVLVLAGCGDQSRSLVSGIVYYDHKPIDQGFISFFGPRGDAGGEIKNGSYAVSVPVGAMRVVISMGEISGYKELYHDPKAPGPAPKQALTREVLPAKYSSREKTILQLDVTAGGVRKNWELPKE